MASALVFGVIAAGLLSSALGARHVLDVEADLEAMTAFNSGQVADHCEEVHDVDYKHPEAWAKKEGDEACGGTLQSPVPLVANYPDLKGSRRGAAGKLATKYEALSGLSVHNSGHSFQVNGKFGTLTVKGEDYEAAQFHLHWQSEHQVDWPHPRTRPQLQQMRQRQRRQRKTGNKLDAMELHIVHVCTGCAKKYAVVGILFEVDPRIRHGNPCIEQMLAAAQKLKPGCDAKLDGAMDLNSCFREQLEGNYYQYDGSLTTPPCTESVLWTVMQVRAKIGLRTFHRYRSFFRTSTNRPLQALNNRVVEYIDVAR